MKNLLLVLVLALASASAFSWQCRHADVLRQRNAGLRAQLSQNEQIVLQQEGKNEAAHKFLEESETVLLDLETRLARDGRRPWRGFLLRRCIYLDSAEHGPESPDSAAAFLPWFA